MSVKHAYFIAGVLAIWLMSSSSADTAKHLAAMVPSTNQNNSLCAATKTCDGSGLTRTVPGDDLSHSMNSGDTMRIIVNWDENCMWDYFFAQKKPAVNDPQVAKHIIEEIIDEHAVAEVDTVVHCFFGAGFKGCVWESKVADCLIGTESGVKLRPPALDEAGIDFLRVIMDRCHKRGMRFLAGLRMNDRHGFAPDKFATEHPQWNLNMNGGGFDYTYEPVRQHVLDFVEEVLEKCIPYR